MPLILQVPDSYGLVLAVATSTFFVNTFHSFRTSKLRKAAGVKYPNAYATAEQAAKDPAAHRFNSAQRAHANFTENYTPNLAALLIAGLHFPVGAAVVGAGWTVSRVLYVCGYTSSSGPQGRLPGVIGATITSLALTSMAAYTSFVIATGK